MQQRLPKFRRQPEAVGKRRITNRTVQIIRTIECYRLLPTSLLLRLVGGNEDVTQRHLQYLYHTSLVNRFSFPKLGTPGEFHYYLDNPDALRMLVEYTGMQAEALDWEGVRRNREKRYSDIHDRRKADEALGRQVFLKHEVMISRFHAMLELACRQSRGEVELTDWRQGPELWDRIEVPRVAYDPTRQVWYEADDSQILPHRPDAFFSLHFPTAPEGQTKAHFFYEADRKRTSTRKMQTKLRAHFHFIARQKRHQEKYQIQRVRAVLIETLDTAWAEELRQAARHPIVSGNKPTPLFWFTASEIFTQAWKVPEGTPPSKVPRFLEEPQLIFQKVWATPLTRSGQELVSLLD